MYLVHLIKVGLTVMKLPKGPRVAITPPKELTGQVKICNLPLFSCSRTLFLFFVLQEPLLTNFLWMSDDVLVVNWMNRIQNHSIHLRSSLQCSCSSLFLINVFQHYLGQSSFMTHSGSGNLTIFGLMFAIAFRFFRPFNVISRLIGVPGLRERCPVTSCLRRKNRLDGEEYTNVQCFQIVLSIS